ncbi:MAG TPA: portal protein, partial [Anaerolineales bacterium]
MAKKKTSKPAEDTPEDKPRAEKKDLLKRLRQRYKLMTEDPQEKENRTKGMEDMEFVHIPGKQWDDTLKKNRGKRPCYEFNKLRVTEKRVINHIRANRPTWKVRAVEDGDKDTADVYDGLMRNIWNTSDADSVVDYQAEYSVGAGYGVFRITTEYSDDSAFDQDIFIRGFKNPMCVYADPASSDMMKRDAEDWIVTEKISKSSFEQKWPSAKRVSFEDDEFDHDEDWEDEETVRICEYWYKKPVTKTLYLLKDGQTVDAVTPGAEVVRSREVRTHKICMVIASGDAILEGPTEWAIDEFPFIPIYGEWVCINGKVIWYGLTRHSKDAQREYNYSRTAIAETIAQTPSAKHWMTPAQLAGLEKHVADAHAEGLPVALYNPDPLAPGPPQRLGGADVPVALIQEAGLSSEDIKSTSGIFDASLGNQTNETSGRAINARQMQGEIATYNFPDNVAKAARRAGELLVKLIPKIYDTARSIRILGPDLAEKYVKINEPEQDPETGAIKIANDLGRGKYDLTVSSGPNFSTQRQEATQVYGEIATRVPQLWAVAGDLMMRGMDLPYAEQIAERMQAILPPQIQEQLKGDKPLPPEVQAVMQQANQAMQIVQQQSQLVQAAAAEAEQKQADAEKAESKVKAVIEQLKTEEARFEAKVAKVLADIATKEAQLAVKGSQIDIKGHTVETQSQKLEAERGKVVLADEANNAIENIKALTQGFAQVASDLADKLDPPPKPKTKKN